MINNSVLRKFHVFFSSIFLFLFHLPFVFAKAKPVVNLHGIISDVPSLTGYAPMFRIGDAGENEEIGKISVYDSLRLNTLGLARQAYDYAIKGFSYLRSTGYFANNNIITIADFSQPSHKKRLYVIDLNNYKVLFNTYVAHGMNTGREIATKFSNIPESNQSSLGFYKTLGTYQGGHGYSLKLEGLERGINDNAYNRAIVMHSADYVSEDFIRNQGFIGRSWGCPALPAKLNKPIIDRIKSGSCLFIYSTNKNYSAQSKVIRSLAKIAA